MTRAEKQKVWPNSVPTYLANIYRLPTCFRLCTRCSGTARNEPGSVSASGGHSLVRDVDK